jgi:hypothetical protein
MAEVLSGNYILFLEIFSKIVSKIQKKWQNMRRKTGILLANVQISDLVKMPLNIFETKDHISISDYVKNITDAK